MQEAAAVGEVQLGALTETAQVAVAFGEVEQKQVRARAAGTPSVLEELLRWCGEARWVELKEAPKARCEREVALVALLLEVPGKEVEQRQGVEGASEASIVVRTEVEKRALPN